MPRVRQDNDARYALRASFVDENGDVIQGDTIVIDNSVPTFDFNLVDDLTPQLGGNLDFNGFFAYNVEVDGTATFNDNITVGGTSTFNGLLKLKNGTRLTGGNVRVDHSNVDFRFAADGSGGMIYTVGPQYIRFQTNSTDRMYIDSNGTVSGLWTYNGSI